MQAIGAEIKAFWQDLRATPFGWCHDDYEDAYWNDAHNPDVESDKWYDVDEVLGVWRWTLDHRECPKTLTLGEVTIRDVDEDDFWFSSQLMVHWRVQYADKMRVTLCLHKDQQDALRHFCRDNDIEIIE